MWYFQSRKVLLPYGLTASKLDPTLYCMNNGSLIVATQMDDFLYIGSAEEMKKDESYIKKNYKVGSIKCGEFSFNGVNISQRE